MFVKNGVDLGFGAKGFSFHMDEPPDESGVTAVGEARLMHDVSTLRRIPW